MSIEGRPIYVLEITSPTGDLKPAFFFNGTQHAREWISPMTVLYVVDRMLGEYATDPDIQALLDDLRLYVVPMVNPDGYEFCWSDNRLWRKNRRNNGDGTFGVDLNRNWATGWGGPGSSGNTNDITYRGPAPFSEPETQALRNFMLAHPDIVAYIDFHSYAQLVLWPYGYDYVLPPEPDLTEMTVLGEGMAAEIFDVHGKEYTPQPTYELYLAAGVASDWVYDGAGAHAFTIELRDTGQYGFELPPDQIIPTGEEIYPAVLLLADWAKDQVQVKIELADTLPTILAPGEGASVSVNISAVAEEVVEGSPTLFYRYDGGAFIAQPLVDLGDGLFEGTLPPVTCSDVPEFYFAAEGTTTGLTTLPAGAPGELFDTLVGTFVVTLEDAFETDLGWTVDAGADTGNWERADPEEVVYNQGSWWDPDYVTTQPEDDHTPDGTLCYVTGPLAGSGGGELRRGRRTVTPDFARLRPRRYRRQRQLLPLVLHRLRVR